ncbi:MAG: PspA/IM30 family protein [Planctomycetaceae bacterium]
MGLFKRISDIISANLNDLTEQYEDPEKMLKQAIREMEESIEQATREAAKTIASEKRLRKELAKNEQEVRRWLERAQQAVDAGDDELAKKALGRKGEYSKLARALQDQVDAITEASVALRRQLDGMKAKLAEAKRNLATLTARQRAADVRKKALTASDEFRNVSLDDDAFKKFDRMREKVELAEAEAEALAELRGDVRESELENELDLMPPSDIEDELAVLKRNSGK